jgi:hypothetical protein
MLEAESAEPITGCQGGGKGGSVKKPFDWEGAGKFFAMLLDLFMLIRVTFLENRIGLRMLQWILDEKGGKRVFVQEFLQPLGRKYAEAALARLITPTELEVYLDAPPPTPSLDATVFRHADEGSVTLAYFDGDLCIDGTAIKLVDLHRAETYAHVRGLLEAQAVNANVASAIYRFFPYHLPLAWKQVALSGAKIYFLGTEYREGVCMYLAYLRWDNGAERWEFGYSLNPFVFEKDAVFAVLGKTA